MKQPSPTTKVSIGRSPDAKTMRSSEPGVSVAGVKPRGATPLYAVAIRASRAPLNTRDSNR